MVGVNSTLSRENYQAIPLRKASAPWKGVSPQRAPLAERGEDFYPTPIEAIRSFIAIEGARLPGNIWEPACGDGAIVLPLRLAGYHVLATDLVYRGCPDSIGGVDIADGVASAKRHFDPARFGIITNPPYHIARAFAECSLGAAPYVALLLRLQFLEGVSRRNWFIGNGPSRIHVSSRRLPRMHRDGWAGPKTTSTQAFAWFVWDEPVPAPTVHFFDWKDFA